MWKGNVLFIIHSIDLDQVKEKKFGKYSIDVNCCLDFFSSETIRKIRVYL